MIVVYYSLSERSRVTHIPFYISKEKHAFFSRRSHRDIQKSMDHWEIQSVGVYFQLFACLS